MPGTGLVGARVVSVRGDFTALARTTPFFCVTSACKPREDRVVIWVLVVGIGLGKCNCLARTSLLCQKTRVHWTGLHRLLDSTTWMVSMARTSLLCQKGRGLSSISIRVDICTPCRSRTLSRTTTLLPSASRQRLYPRSHDDGTHSPTALCGPTSPFHETLPHHFMKPYPNL